MRLEPRRIPLAAVVCCLIVTAAPAAFAQTNLQRWGNPTLDWAKSARLVYEVDFEPKVLILYMWTRSRDTVQAGFKPHDNTQRPAEASLLNESGARGATMQTPTSVSKMPATNPERLGGQGIQPAAGELETCA